MVFSLDVKSSDLRNNLFFFVFLTEGFMQPRLAQNSSSS